MTSDTPLPSDPLISAATLKEWVDGDVSPVILDASWFLPTDHRSGAKEFDDAHIKGAQFFDINDLSAKNTPLPTMMPSIDRLSNWLGDNGISEEDVIVLVDNSRYRTACRGWWMLKSLGHEKLYLLDGGMTAWRKAAFPVSPGPSAPREATKYHPRPTETPLFIARDEIDLKQHSIIDARSQERFAGFTPEPRASLRAGHIPGSRNVPYSSLFDRNGLFLSKEQLRAAMAMRTKRPVVTSCGSGITAAILAFTLLRLGRENVCLYDGSWAEWGSAQPEIAGAEPMPIETGPGPARSN